MIVDGFVLLFVFFFQRKFYGPEQRWMLISGKKTILFCQNNFFSHKTKYKMCSVTSLRVISHVTHGSEKIILQCNVYSS